MTCEQIDLGDDFYIMQKNLLMKVSFSSDTIF